MAINLGKGVYDTTITCKGTIRSYNEIDTGERTKCAVKFDIVAGGKPAEAAAYFGFNNIKDDDGETVEHAGAYNDGLAIELCRALGRETIDESIVGQQVKLTISNNIAKAIVKISRLD